MSKTCPCGKAVVAGGKYCKRHIAPATQNLKTKYSTPCTKRIAEDLRAARLLQGIGQYQLSELAGVCITTVVDYENDQTGMKLHILEKLAASLGKQLVVKLV
jgi:DNA-binding XRE family transcriptional regulator